MFSNNTSESIVSQERLEFPSLTVASIPRGTYILSSRKADVFNEQCTSIYWKVTLWHLNPYHKELNYFTCQAGT